MKTQTMATKVTMLNNRLGNPASSRISQSNSSLILSEIQDKEFLLLPEIQLPGAMTSGSCSPRLDRSLSRSCQDPMKADIVIRINDDARKKINRSLIDIREESFDSDKSSSPTPSRREDRKENVNDNSTNRLPRVHLARGQVSSPKLLHNRNQQSRASLVDSPGVSPTQIEVCRLGPQQMPVHIQHNRLYLKSQSQTDFSLAEKENLFPSIQQKSSSARDVSSEHRDLNPFPKLVPIGQAASRGNGTLNSGTTTSGVINNASGGMVSVETTPAAPTTTGTKAKADRKVTMLSPRTRSSSVVSFLPCRLPSLLSKSKSNSQPDISKSSSTSSTTSSASSSAPVEFLACHPMLARKQRVRKLWRRAGEKLGLRQGDPNSDGGSMAAWAKGPGDLLRPVYSRWCERRHALAEPERMCMPQEVRERIEKDVQDRRRSLKRRVSNFFTVKFGLNNEEDLAA